MKTIYLICNQSTEPFIFEPQDNEVSKYRQKELKELFEKEASGIEEIYSNKNVEMYKTCLLYTSKSFYTSKYNSV